MISKFFQIAEGDLLLVNSRISEELAKDENYVIQANKLKNCSQTWNTFMCDCKFVRFKKRCYYKVCPKCGKIRVMDLFDKFIGVFKKRRVARSIYDNGLRFLTLTIKNQEGLRDGLDKLYFFFKQLRNRKYWKNKVKGGVAGFHAIRGKDGLWNVHLHIILDSSYLDMKTHKKTGEDSKLVQEWKHCTGGDGIIEIKRVRTHKGALLYILNYVSGCAFELSDEDKALFFKATFRQKLFFAFGKKSEGIYGLKIKKERRTCPDCGGYYQYILPLSEEYELAQAFFSEKKPPPPKDLNDWFNILERRFG
ncbi:protein rep [Candidatus Pacearchaeota archaeon]|nr:protein rep [Candidatus Pacearchaeota archaeon]